MIALVYIGHLSFVICPLSLVICRRGDRTWLSG